MKQSILLVANKSEIINDIEKTLEPLYSLTIINEISEVKNFTKYNQVDLMIINALDYKVNWFEVVTDSSFCAGNNSVPIIFSIESQDIDMLQGALDLNNVDIVQIPVIPQVLLKRIKNHIELTVCKVDIEEAIKDKTEAIERLQDVILMSIVELVECRDGTTGGHIKRTAKYVNILVNELVSRGIYKETLTPQHVKDMIRSAPLHDLGKIGISDSTLLKEGSLDEEEFEFMKTHSALGGKTIQKIIDQANEQSFLDTAKDMANYHHEKWDGSGYPEGLKGEAIPVSARIMAIADVYDALTTKRPYKKALSHYEAVNIMLKGMRTSFDPIILDVFEEIHTEFEKVKEVYDDQNR